MTAPVLNNISTPGESKKKRRVIYRVAFLVEPFDVMSQSSSEQLFSQDTVQIPTGAREAGTLEEDDKCSRKSSDKVPQADAMG